MPGNNEKTNSPTYTSFARRFWLCPELKINTLFFNILFIQIKFVTYTLKYAAGFHLPEIVLFQKHSNNIMRLKHLCKCYFICILIEGKSEEK